MHIFLAFPPANPSPQSHVSLLHFTQLCFLRRLFIVFTSSQINAQVSRLGTDDQLLLSQVSSVNQTLRLMVHAFLQSISSYGGSGTPTLGSRRNSFPLCPLPWGQEGQKFPFILNSFHLSYLAMGHFPSL